jgi:ribonuclease E
LEPGDEPDTDPTTGELLSDIDPADPVSATNSSVAQSADAIEPSDDANSPLVGGPRIGPPTRPGFVDRPPPATTPVPRGNRNAPPPARPPIRGPVVVRPPVPGSRMSFGKGKTRHQFRPTNVRGPWPPRAPLNPADDHTLPTEPIAASATPAETRPLPPAIIDEVLAPLDPLNPRLAEKSLLPLDPDSSALASFSEDIEIDEEADSPARKRVPTGREMLINVAEGEEVRIAITQNGQLEELYMERSSTESHIGNIYKGRVTNIEPSIQAAFIDFGIGKNGFLHISDLHPQYFPEHFREREPRGGRAPRGRSGPSQADAKALAEKVASVEVAAEARADTDENGLDTPPIELSPDGNAPAMLPTESNGTGAHDGASADASLSTAEAEGHNDNEREDGFEDDYEVDDAGVQALEKVGRKIARRDRPTIQACLRRGQEVLVQVIKEGIGTKGPTLTTYISIPGRYLVMMPGMKQLGVSRKIDDDAQRRSLRKILEELNPPKNLGFIVRTAGIEQSKKEIQADLNYLVRMWKVIASRIRNQKSPSELYEESDLVIRTIRDVFNSSIDRITVDSEAVASRVRDFLSIVNPRNANLVELYTGQLPLFQRYNVEREIEKINSRRVEMPNGGSLVIDSAEALVAIDVNSGRYRETRDAEMSAFNVNREAVHEVCRQLRLRDLGGVVVIDFIDMREERHRREIERLLKEELKNDRAKTKVLRMSLFCMIEMTRQRVRASLKRSIYQDCPHCRGSALIKTPESASLDVMRRLATALMRADVLRVDVRAYPTIAEYLLNKKRKQLVELEDRIGKKINVQPDPSLAGDATLINGFDIRGNQMLVAL